MIPPIFYQIRLKATLAALHGRREGLERVLHQLNEENRLSETPVYDRLLAETGLHIFDHRDWTERELRVADYLAEHPWTIPDDLS